MGYRWSPILRSGANVGQEEFDRLRTLSYADTHVIMLCFPVDSKDSLENVEEKWWGEIGQHCDGIHPSPPNPCPSFKSPSFSLYRIYYPCILLRVGLWQAFDSSLRL